MRLTDPMQEEMTRLVEPQIPALRRYAALLTREHGGADDLVQDCLERALARWSSRQPGSDVRPWLFSILHNLAIDQFRRIERRGRHIAFDEVDEGFAAQRASQEDALQVDDLLRTVDRLPPEQRTVLLLVAVEGMSYGEAAAVVGVPVGTIMSRLHRARSSLHREMIGQSSGTPHLRTVQ